MITLFISHAPADGVCAETIRRELEAQGYAVFREPGYPGPSEASYPHMIENAILGSAALVLLWSSAAAREGWVARHIHFAQRLHKLILPVTLDATPLPNTQIVNTTISCQPLCDDAAAQLLPHLAQLDTIAPLTKLSEQAANRDRILSQKEAIEQASVMLRRGEYREEVLAILEYLAKEDLVMGVRDKAQEALEADAKRDAPPTPPPFAHLGNPNDIFGVRCKNGHITYFNKRQACSDKSSVVRDRAGKQLNELHLKCGTCREVMAILIDCEGY